LSSGIVKGGLARIAEGIKVFYKLEPGFMFDRKLIHGFLLMIAMLSVVNTAHARPDFTGKWENAEWSFDMRTDVYATEADYTPEAWANLQDYFQNWDYKGVDDPAKFCVNYGMPRMMGTARDYIVDINQTASRITVIVEYMDNFRIIHMDKAAVPDSVSPSNNGYSIGRWEGDTLVIETTALKARNPVGKFQRSAEARITERWSLGKDAKFGKVLNIDSVVDDPKVFRHPFKSRQKYKLAPAGAALNEYGCADTLWDDHVERVRAERAAQKQGGAGH